ncbi:MAG: NAD-dependent epimerase/dehydratase family protein [Bacteroidales bacterium]|nr:NAD-dependent epimerase/dehydratase family protein [Bacteroidales bacterium]MBN2818607.1 NAD-dependent epimerase/dehydratase family protein [Bacteroidales bacterium]
MEKILIIGAAGQIGSELTMELRRIHGNENVFATDIKDAPYYIRESGPFQFLDVMDDRHLIHFVIRNKITQIYHLAAVLSGNAEKLPLQAWSINMNSLMNVLEVAKMVEDVKKVFWPSSIAVFGPSTPKENTPQITIKEPNTVYGISKLAGERWCDYYFNQYGVDVRSIRYPGLISYKTEPGGGTTDFAVEIYYEAIKNKKYTCFLGKNTRLPLMFMPDAVAATIALMETPQDEIYFHTGYNIAGFSSTPGEMADSIRKYIPEFEITYVPDFRQEIADSWPDSIDDHYARSNDHWSSKYDLEQTTKIMIEEIRKKI